MTQATAQAARHTPASRYLRCEGRELHYVEWGAPDAPPVIMWHGLARTGRDFDELAQALADDYRIICPDAIGRGLSQWSPDPVAEYRLDFYARLAGALADGLGLARLRWVGTSMGGATGMHAAATTLRDRISHLVVNDIGPTLPQPAIDRILAYAGQPPAFDTVTELETWLRAAYKPYGWQSDEQWRRMAETSVRRLPDGRVTAHYDPAIVGQFSHHPGDYERWEGYDSLRMPLLLLRGADSDLLLPDVAHAMTQRGPRAQRIDFPDCGHAPALNIAPQINAVRQFLAQPDHAAATARALGDNHDETRIAGRDGRPVHAIGRHGQGLRRGPRLRQDRPAGSLCQADPERPDAGPEYATQGTMTVAGRKIRVIEKDNQGKPDVARAQLASAYADDNADIAVGPTSRAWRWPCCPSPRNTRRSCWSNPPWRIRSPATSGTSTSSAPAAIPRRTPSPTPWPSTRKARRSPCWRRTMPSAATA